MLVFNRTVKKNIKHQKLCIVTVALNTCQTAHITKRAYTLETSASRARHKSI